MKPLIKETIKKAVEINPRNAQTGPASRRDMETIRKHLAYLSNEPDMQRIYEILSENIIKLRTENKNANEQF